MRLTLIKYGNIILTIMTIPLVQSPLCLILIVRLGVYTVNLYDFYSWRLIGKLNSFLKIQEFTSGFKQWTHCETCRSLSFRF